MAKKISISQLLGKIGEKRFEAWATEIGLFPTKLDPDMGIDYVCQVVGEKTAKTSYDMVPRLVAMSIKSSSKAGLRTKLNRDDAQLLIKLDLPAAVVMVHLSAKPSHPIFYIRFLDKEFVEELANFLQGTNKTLSIRARKCTSDTGEIKAKIKQICDPRFKRDLDFYRKQLRVTRAIKGAELHITASPTGGFTLIQIPNFLTQFDLSNEQARFQMEAAVFGSQELLGKRLEAIPFRSELLDAFAELPEPIIIGAGIPEGENVSLAAHNSLGTASCTFQVKYHDIWTGYWHPCGLALKISKAVEREGTRVHLTELFVDPTCKVSSLLKGEIRNFLEHSTEEAEIIFNSKLRLPVAYFSDLSPLGWLCRYMPDIREVDEIDLSEWNASDFSEEDLQSLRILSLLGQSISFFDGFCFVFDDYDIGSLIPEPQNSAIPLCMNIRNQGFVCWLEIRVERLIEKTQSLCVGIRIIETKSMELVKGDRKYPTSGVPKFKICAEWPGIGFYGKGHGFTWNGGDDWGLGLTTID